MKYDKTTENNYDYWQNKFDGHSSYMLAADYNEYAVLRRLILTFIEDGERVLDVGCASGDTFTYAQQLGKNLDYVGTDYAEKFIEANKVRMPDGVWEVMDARELTYSDNSFDSVILYDVLDGLPGWEEALDEAIRVSRKKVFVLMWMDPEMGKKKQYMLDHGLSVLEMDVQGSVHYHKFLMGVK